MAMLQPQPIGQSESFMALMDNVSDVAALDRPVVIVGEHGTGKELIASRLHFLSPRWEQIFITVNCAAFTDQALDEELFGQSFLDGREDTNGRFYQSDGGTLFLDNIEAVSPRLQEKLMRAIEYGQYEARGELQTQDVNVRVIAASSIDLPSAVASGLFREDLLYRLAFNVLHLPPLRERQADILPLSEHFGRKIAAELGADSFPGVNAEMAEILQTHSWSGNVRELKSVIERSTAQAWLKDETLSAPLGELQFNPFDSPYRLPATQRPHAPSPPQSQMDAPIDETTLAASPKPTPPPPTQNLTERVMIFERRIIDEALKVHSNHQGNAAEALGLTYHQFRGLLRKHGLKK